MVSVFISGFLVGATSGINQKCRAVGSEAPSNSSGGVFPLFWDVDFTKDADTLHAGLGLPTSKLGGSGGVSKARDHCF